MNIRILTCVRRYRAEFHAGNYFARRLYIRTAPRELIRLLRDRLTDRTQRRSPAWKPARIALYAGAFLCHRRERALVRHFRL